MNHTAVLFINAMSHFHAFPAIRFTHTQQIRGCLFMIARSVMQSVNGRPRVTLRKLAANIEAPTSDGDGDLRSLTAISDR